MVLASRAQSDTNARTRRHTHTHKRVHVVVKSSSKIETHSCIVPTCDSLRLGVRLCCLLHPFDRGLFHSQVVGMRLAHRLPHGSGREPAENRATS
eukprot:5291439-Prymnesium_polylepis.1